MTLTTHAATGMLVTQWTQNPFIGFFVAVLSHYLTDAIPHGDEWAYWRHVHNPKDIVAFSIATCDVSALVILVIAVLNYHPEIDPMMIAVSVIGAILPDICIMLHTRNRGKFRTEYPGILLHIQKWYHLFLKQHYRLHMTFHNAMHTPIRFRTAIAYQSVFLFFFVYYFVL